MTNKLQVSLSLLSLLAAVTQLDSALHNGTTTNKLLYSMAIVLLVIGNKATDRLPSGQFACCFYLPDVRM